MDARDVPGGRRLTFRTKEEAEQARADAVRLGRQGMATPQDRDITLAEFATQWLAQVTPTLEARTVQSYAGTLRLHIIPTLGTTKVRMIARGHVRALMADKAKAGLGVNSLRIIKATMSVILAEALEQGIVLVNVASGLGRIARPTQTAGVAEEEAKPKALTLPELDALLRAAVERWSPAGATLVLAMADCGLRPGEACGLQWADVDAQAGTLRIARAIENGGRIKATKTHKVRKVDASRRLLAALSALRDTEQVEALTGGREMSAWCFPGEAPDALSKRFARLVEAAGLPEGATPYTCRHTYASQHLNGGTPLTYVSAQLGHANPATTLKHYAHLTDRTTRHHADALEAKREAAWHRFGTDGVSEAVVPSQLTESATSGRGSSVVEQLIRNQ